MLWTAERVEQAVKLWENGFTASQVAERLGHGATRSSVLGKLHRIGKAERPDFESVKIKKWNAESENELLALDDAGKSTAEIAGILGRSLFSIKHRLSVLSKRRTPRALAFAQRRQITYSHGDTRREIIGTERQAPMRVRVEEPYDPNKPRIPLTALTESVCHWPLGNPGEDTFGFCGQPSRHDSPYCCFHHRIGYQPQWAQAKARRKAEWVSKAIR